MPPIIEVGVHVEPTKEHYEQLGVSAKKPRTTGIVVAKSRTPNCWVVQWVGLATAETLDASYIKPVQMQ